MSHSSRTSRRQILIGMAGVAATTALSPGCCFLRKVVCHPCSTREEWTNKSRPWWKLREAARDKQRKAEKEAGKRPNVPLPVPFLTIGRERSSRGWLGDQVKRYPLNQWGEVAFVVQNKGNAPSWSCYVEIYEGPWGAYGVSFGDMKLKDRKVVTVRVGQKEEVVLKWMATQVPGHIIIRCYDPAQDQALLTYGQYDRKNSGVAWSQGW